MRRNQEKLENSFAEVKAELKAKISRMNNAEGISDLKDRIIEMTQLKQKDKWKKVKTILRDLGYNIMCAIYAYQGFQKEKKGIRGLKMYLKKLWLKTSQP